MYVTVHNCTLHPFDDQVCMSATNNGIRINVNTCTKIVYFMKKNVQIVSQFAVTDMGLIGSNRFYFPPCYEILVTFE
jgi:hypothetical protein